MYRGDLDLRQRPEGQALYFSEVWLMETELLCWNCVTCVCLRQICDLKDVVEKSFPALLLFPVLSCASF